MNAPAQSLLHPPPLDHHPHTQSTQVAPAAQELLQSVLSVRPPPERPGLQGSTPAVVLGLVAVVVFQAVYTVYDLAKETLGLENKGEQGVVVDSVVLAAVCTALLWVWLRA